MEIVLLIIVFLIFTVAYAAGGAEAAIWVLFLGAAAHAVLAYLAQRKQKELAKRIEALEGKHPPDRLAALEQRNNQQLGSLTARVYALEQRETAPRKVEVPAAAPPMVAEPPAAARVRAPEPVQPLVRPAPPTAPPPPQPPPVPPAAATPAAEMSAATPPATKPVPVEPPTPPPVARPAPGAPPLPPGQGAPLAATPTQSPRAPAPRPQPPASAAPPPRRSFDLEETLGANWLGKLGVILFVLGIALGIAYFWDKIPAIGKVSLGYLSGGGMLGLGVWLEKRERYRMFARGLIGGGWALLFYTTYAMHHVAAAQVIASQTVDLVLMLAVAAAMVAHTLRYRSQLVTGFAFLLGFTTVTLSHDTVYSLSAGAVLALGLVVLVVRMQWYELEVFGVLASYLNHYLWLQPIVEKMGEPRHPFPEFYPSVALLLFYWLVFRISYIARKIEDAKQEGVSTVACLLNGFLLLALMKYQSVRPELAFWFLLGLGAAELVLGQLPITRRRRLAFIVLTTLGATLLVAAFPFRYSGSNLSVLWLMAAEAFFLVGVFMPEIVFRRLGMVTGALTAAHLLFVDAQKVFFARAGVASPPAENGLAAIFALAAAVFYLNAEFISRRWSTLFEEEFDTHFLRGISYAGGAMAAVAAWLVWPTSGTAVAWAALALALAFAGRRLKSWTFSRQAMLLAAMAFVRALASNLDLSDRRYGLTLRLLTVGAVAGLLYLCSRWSTAEESSAETAWLRGAHTWAASFLVVLIAWYEMPEPWIAAIWMAFALLLGLLGREWSRSDFTLQANLLAAASVVRVLAFNVDLTTPWHGVTLRLATVALVTTLLYLFSRWSEARTQAWTRHLPTACTWAASYLVALLAWYELRTATVALAWALLGIVLFELGFRRRSLSLRLQGYVALLAAFARMFFVNLNAVAEPGTLSPRVYTVIPLAVAFYYVYESLHGHDDDFLDWDRRQWVPQLFAYLGTITLVALIRFEFDLDWVIAGWAALLIALLALALVTGRNLFLGQAMLLNLAIVFRAAFHNFYERTYFPGASWWHSRSATVGAAVAALFLSLLFAFPLRRRMAEAPAGRMRWLVSRPEQMLFFAAVALLTVLLTLEVRTGWVTIAWGLEGVAIFLLALWLGQRSYRITGLALLLLCVGKIVLVDTWGMEARARILTFIILGVALILVGFLYAKYKEAFRQLL